MCISSNQYTAFIHLFYSTGNQQIQPNSTATMEPPSYCDLEIASVTSSTTNGDLPTYDTVAMILPETPCKSSNSSPSREEATERYCSPEVTSSTGDLATGSTSLYIASDEDESDVINNSLTELDKQAASCVQEEGRDVETRDVPADVNSDTTHAETDIEEVSTLQTTTNTRPIDSEGRPITHTPIDDIDITTIAQGTTQHSAAITHCSSTNSLSSNASCDSAKPAGRYQRRKSSTCPDTRRWFKNRKMSAQATAGMEVPVLEDETADDAFMMSNGSSGDDSIENGRDSEALQELDAGLVSEDSQLDPISNPVPADVVTVDEVMEVKPKYIVSKVSESALESTSSSQTTTTATTNNTHKGHKPHLKLDLNSTSNPTNNDDTIQDIDVTKPNDDVNIVAANDTASEKGSTSGDKVILRFERDYLDSHMLYEWTLEKRNSMAAEIRKVEMKRQSRPPKPADWIVLSCMVMVCCNPPLGITALCFSRKSERLDLSYI